MIYFITAGKKIIRIFYFIKITLFHGFKKAYYYYKLYIYFSEQKFRSFSDLSKKKSQFFFKKNDYFNKLSIEYLNAISFHTFEDAAKLRLKLDREYKSNDKFKKLATNFLDFKFNRSIINFEKKNRDFKNFIKNKNLIFIGPGIGNNTGVSIDKIIVCTNISDEILKFKKNKKISYFSNRRVNLFKEETKNKINKCDYSIVKSKSSFDKLNLKHKNLRFLENKKYFLFGSPMMLQLVLLDLINHNPKKIILKNFDLYTKKKIYRKNYRTEKNQLEINKKNILSLRVHDALSNFIFLKNLYLNYSNLIILDKKLNNVLRLNLLDYAKILDKNLINNVSLINNVVKRTKTKNEKY